MFLSKNDYQILHQALTKYKGLYDGHIKERLTKNEQERHDESISTALKLQEKIEEILIDNYAIDQRFEEIEHKLGT